MDSHVVRSWRRHSFRFSRVARRKIEWMCRPEIEIYDSMSLINIGINCALRISHRTADRPNDGEMHGKLICIHNNKEEETAYGMRRIHILLLSILCVYLIRWHFNEFLLFLICILTRSLFLSVFYPFCFASPFVIDHGGVFMPTKIRRRNSVFFQSKFE